MKVVKFLFLILLISGTVNFAQSKMDAPDRVKFNPAADPFADLKTAVVEAKKEDKNILLDVGGEWCIWCHRLDAFTANDKEIKSFLEDNFVEVKINYSEENKNEKFLLQYPKVSGYPHIFILDNTGKLIVSKNTGELEDGKSYSAKKIMEFLKTYAPEKKK